MIITSTMFPALYMGKYSISSWFINNCYIFSWYVLFKITLIILSCISNIDILIAISWMLQDLVFSNLHYHLCFFIYVRILLLCVSNIFLNSSYLARHPSFICYDYK